MMPMRSVQHAVRGAKIGWLCSASRDEWKVTMAEIERRNPEEHPQAIFYEQRLEDMDRQARSYLSVETQQGESIEAVEGRFRTRLDEAEPVPPLGQITTDTIRAHYRGGEPLPWAEILASEQLDATGRSEVLGYLRWTVGRRRQLVLWAWQEDKLLFHDERFYPARPDEPPTKDLLQWLGAIDWTENQDRQIGERHVAMPRPIIAPAFFHDGRQGLGRISSDQVTFGLYDALIAPKEEWAKTAKGWPIYRPDPTSDRLAIKVTPIVENRGNLDAQRDEMWQIVQELSIADFDVLAMMMAQVLEEARNDGRAILPADAMLDYRGVGQRIGDDGYSAGRQPKMRMALSESVYRIAHLKITTDGFPILGYNSKGGVISSPMDINEPILQLHSSYSRQRDDKTMLWEYSLGRWFTTFREKPNAFTAYMLERALAYHPTKQQWTKQLAYYLAFDMRRNADNGQELAGPISRFMDGARIPCDPRYALKARDRFENSLRQVVKDGLIRIVQGDDIIDASSPGVDAWLPGGADALKGRDWLGAYRKLRIRLRCDEDIEQRYDIEIRKKKASVIERKARKEAAGPTAKGQAK